MRTAHVLAAPCPSPAWGRQAWAGLWAIGAVLLAVASTLLGHGLTAALVRRRAPAG